VLLVVNKKLIDSPIELRVRVHGNVDVGSRYVLLDVESLGSVISLQNCFIARRRKKNMIDLLHILPYQYEDIPSTMHFCSHVSSTVETSNKDR